MFKYITLGVAVVAVALFSNCQKKAEETTSTNIATQVASNLSTISTNYTPNSLDSANTSSGVSAQADPCANTTDFAVCQSNLIREYLQIGKNMVDMLQQITGQVGTALGQIPDGNVGSSNNGQISWNKTSGSVWSVLAKNTGGHPFAYFSINNNTYNLRIDLNYDDESPQPTTVEATVTFTDANTWDVDVFFSKTSCDSTDVGAPSKAHIKLNKANGLWAGKAMLYMPRWKNPNVAVTCSTTPDATTEIAMYTDFVGNDVSTKAALYLIPPQNQTGTNYSGFGIPNLCTNFASACGGSGPADGTALASYMNNWCTTGAGTSPLWGTANGGDCQANPTVSAASFSADSNWTTPDYLKNTKAITALPNSL